MRQELDALQNMEQSKKILERNIEEVSAKLEQLEKEEDELINKSAELGNNIKGLSKKSGKYTGGCMLWPLPCSDNVTSPFGIRFQSSFAKI